MHRDGANTKLVIPASLERGVGQAGTRHGTHYERIEREPVIPAQAGLSTAELVIHFDLAQ